MDTYSSLSTTPHKRAPADPSTPGCVLSRNKLTLATLVVAVVGFAGTAFAAAPIDCAVQFPAAISTTR